ncbi:homoserine kinase [Longispora sp. K20-0274]|uniref:homoserine kinase n=1 Tax=Longispora sp. K20-0274 TaxID=3088255 RepID=UPI00399979FB
MVTIQAPATSANLGPGFDALGLALGLSDDVTVTLQGGGVTVEVTGEGADQVPRDESHLIVRAMYATFDDLGHPRPAGLALSCVNRIPHARGLGSSSAAIVAGVLAARALAGAPDDRAEALRVAGDLEGHPDNVAPCLLGGFTIAWTPAEGARAVTIGPHPAVHPMIFVPQDRGLTKEARAALPASVPHGDASFNAGRSALLVHALTTAPELLFDATEDRLHQGYRAAGAPATAALVADLRSRGVPAVVSGAGPSVLAFVPDNGVMPDITGHNFASWSLGVDTTGARISH